MTETKVMNVIIFLSEYMHMLVCGHTSKSMITIINIADESVMHACDCIAC